MHEPAKAVIVLALSAAVAVWLLGAALHLWPDTGQLAYGNPLPYLKVRMDSGAVKFWVEDFNRLQYERVWLYVNGRLAASGGPGTDAAARCGDEVAAVVKYHSGVKKLEGRILCTQPIKAPGGSETKRAFRLMQVTQAYRSMTGDMDQTGPPLRFDGSCNINYYCEGSLCYLRGNASVAIVTLRPDVIICVGTSCGASYTFSWSSWRPGSVRQIVPIHVFKTPDAPASQLLGGGRGAADIYIVYDYVEYYNRYDLYVYVNGTLVAECHRETSVSRELASWATYKKPNATGAYLTRIYKPGGPVFDGSLTIYEFNGTYGFEVVTNPVDGEVGPSECKPLSPNSTAVMVGGFCFTVDFNVARNEFFGRGPLDRFFWYLYTPNGTKTRSALRMALNAITDLEHNVPRIVAERGNSTVLVYHETYSRQGGSATLRFKALSISSLGAVYANAVLPIDIRLPPPVLPQNATRTYIFSYR
ncbi:MAG: hypothetical protein ACO2PM_21670 [Pyrobaculum sp.]|jgi:hypothetical protein